MEKTQSLMAALFGWAIGSLTMLSLGFGTIPALIGGLVVGAPLAYIAYDPREFMREAHRQKVGLVTEIKELRLPQLHLPQPFTELPSLARIGEVVRLTFAASLIVVCWIVESYYLISIDGTNANVAYPGFLIAVVVFVVMSCIVAISTHVMIWETILDIELSALPAAARDVTNFALLSLGLFNLAAFVIVAAGVVSFLVLLLAIRATAEVCSSPRLIAMASAVIGLLANHFVGSASLGLAAMVASWAAQWFFLHDWAVARKSPQSA